MYSIYTYFEGSWTYYRSKSKFDKAVESLQRFGLLFKACKDGVELSEYSDCY